MNIIRQGTEYQQLMNILSHDEWCMNDYCTSMSISVKGLVPIVAYLSLQITQDPEFRFFLPEADISFRIVTQHNLWLLAVFIEISKHPLTKELRRFIQSVAHFWKCAGGPSVLFPLKNLLLAIVVIERGQSGSTRCWNEPIPWILVHLRRLKFSIIWVYHYAVFDKFLSMLMWSEVTLREYRHS